MGSKVKQKELLEFFRTFSLLLQSKIPINNSLELILKETRNERLNRILKEVYQNIKSGITLSKSFSKHPEIFSDVLIANLRVAEETGRVAEVLLEYTEYIEKMLNLKRKIVQAIRYPIIVIMISIFVVFFMLFFITPTFQDLFHSSQSDLPWLTRILVGISQAISENIIVLVSAIIFLLVGFNSFIKTNRDHINKIIWKLPLISNLYRNNILARFCLAMSILLKSGISLLDALKISKNITGDKFFRNQVDIFIKKIILGERLAKNIVPTKFFDITFSKMLAAGEESAELDKVFYIMSSFYNKEFDYYLDNTISFLEPALIIIVGGIVSIILIALYLPMFEIIKYFGV